MKLLFALCFLTLVALSSAKPQQPHRHQLPPSPPQDHGRGCIYVEGKCQRECEEGTHSYTTGCSPKTPEPTCEEPNPQQERGAICDYTACYCDAPTVRDTASGKCVTLDKCPKKE